MASGCALIAETVDKVANRIEPDGSFATPEDVDFHNRHFVADLHADTLLWDRDLLTRATYGHVDLPRLLEGNTRLQVFAAVTKTPLPRIKDNGQNCVERGDSNLSGMLSFLQGHPARLWFDLEARAMHQAERLHKFALASLDPNQPAEILIIRTASDLEQLLSRRQGARPVIGAVLGLEGVHWLSRRSNREAVQDAVKRLYQAGFRMLALTHRFDNHLADSSEGCGDDDGLTDAGRLVLATAESLGMVIDLAHASRESLLEAAASANGPVVVSHTGVQQSCVSWPCQKTRNLTPDEIRAVARTGGVIGVGYWPAAVGEGIPAIVLAMRKTVEALEDDVFSKEMTKHYGRFDPFDHLALGSDFDGAVTVPFDAANLPLLTAALRREVGTSGERFFPNEAIEKILGKNVLRVLRARLPNDTSATLHRRSSVVEPAALVSPGPPARNQ